MNSLARFFQGYAKEIVLIAFILEILIHSKDMAQLANILIMIGVALLISGFVLSYLKYYKRGRPSKGKKPHNPKRRAQQVIACVDAVASSTNVSKGLSKLYQIVDNLVDENQLTVLEQLFAELNPKRVDITLAVGYLTATLPLASYLEARKKFKKAFYLHLHSIGRNPERLLRGL